jgi:hypothetical protein
MSAPVHPVDILCAVASIKDDHFALVQSMLFRHPQMSLVADNTVKWDTSYSNHFYYMTSTEGDCEVGAVIQDAPGLRLLAQQLKVDSYIYWGSNSDPVSYASFAKVVELMTSEKKPALWGSAAWKPPTAVAAQDSGTQLGRVGIICG